MRVNMTSDLLAFIAKRRTREPLSEIIRRGGGAEHAIYRVVHNGCGLMNSKTVDCLARGLCVTPEELLEISLGRGLKPRPHRYPTDQRPAELHEVFEHAETVYHITGRDPEVRKELLNGLRTCAEGALKTLARKSRLTVDEKEEKVG